MPGFFSPPYSVDLLTKTASKPQTNLIFWWRTRNRQSAGPWETRFSDNEAGRQCRSEDVSE